MSELIYKLIRDNNGVWYFDPIVIFCSTCHLPVPASIDMTIPLINSHYYCYNCQKSTTYNYLEDRWYYSKGLYRTFRVIFHSNTGRWEVQFHDLLKSLYLKYKNTEYAPLIMAEILGQK